MSYKVGRNDLCPCGSGKKFKRCCGFKQHKISKISKPLELVNRSKKWNGKPRPNPT